MRAIRYSIFRGPLELVTLPDPAPPNDGVVIKVEATGLCRSDWHGWMGHDPDITPPHVPGHEFAGTIVAAGPAVRRWKTGARVTTPFCLGCGACEQCRAGQPQVCDRYYQPGFTGPGSFAEFVALPHADVNLVALPDALPSVAAASLGCRFATAWRAVVIQGAVRPGQWLAVHGCGGVGLSAVMIGRAVGARVIAVDIAAGALDLARELGAEIAIDGSATDVPQAIRDATDGGAHVSIDALGSADTCTNSIASLRKRGRHVQIGLMKGDDATTTIAMSPVIGNELEIVGSHGLAAHDYQPMMMMIAAGRLNPERLLRRTISLAEVAEVLPKMTGVGVTVVDRF